MITVDVVLEVEPLGDFTAWPVSEVSERRYLVLSGMMPLEEVATAIAAILAYNEVVLDDDTILNGILLDRHLAEAEVLNAPGGLRFRDTATGAEFLPGCCCGLESWRAWHDVTESRDIFLGHSPDPRLEHHDGGIRLWQDASSPEPTLSISSERLPELLDASERDLRGFLSAVRTWAEATVPDLAASLVAALDEHLQITPRPHEPLPTMHKPVEAARVFTDLLHKADRDPADLTADLAWRTYLEFAQVPFLTADVPDADMLLYQYGVHSFSGEPRFHLSLSRQFSTDRPEHHLWQFDCDLQFAVSARLLALGDENQWWNPAAGPSLTTWAKARRSGPEWLALTDLKPTTVEIGCFPV